MGVVDKLNELNVEEGTSKRFDCIFCGKKNTLSVTKKKGKILWNCFSASCKSKGNVGTDYSKEDLIKEFDSFYQDKMKDVTPTKEQVESEQESSPEPD